MRVLVGVCGGIAAYKAAELVRSLQGHGVAVEVAMTASAEKFVTPLTFAALSRHTVLTSLWQPSGVGTAEEFSIEHIDVAQRIDALVIVPATANMLAKLAHGIADDLLSTIALATKAPVIVAPAMNVNMWEHAATQTNVRVLEERGVRFVAPEAGYLACGMVGSGRLAEVDAIAAAVVAVLVPSKDYEGETVLITAGGTREPVDPVRFLGNRSSGKMGHALASEAVARGARVILVTASDLPAPRGCEVVRVLTVREMAEAVYSALPRASVVIKAAAVGDFRVKDVAAVKIRRDGPMSLELEPTEDIVAGVVKRRREGTLVIAFAAETEDLEARASAKLVRKGVDAIVANDVSLAGLGFESDSNAGLFLTADRRVELAEASKQRMAQQILDEIVSLRKARLELVSYSVAGVSSAFD